MKPVSSAVLAFDGMSAGGSQRVLTLVSQRDEEEESEATSQVLAENDFVEEDDIEISFDGEVDPDNPPEAPEEEMMVTSSTAGLPIISLAVSDDERLVGDQLVAEIAGLYEAEARDAATASTATPEMPRTPPRLRRLPPRPRASRGKSPPSAPLPSC